MSMNSSGKTVDQCAIFEPGSPIELDQKFSYGRRIKTRAGIHSLNERHQTWHLARQQPTLLATFPIRTVMDDHYQGSSSRRPQSYRLAFLMALNGRWALDGDLREKCYRTCSYTLTDRCSPPAPGHFSGRPHSTTRLQPAKTSSRASINAIQRPSTRHWRPVPTLSISVQPNYLFCLHWQPFCSICFNSLPAPRMNSFPSFH